MSTVREPLVPGGQPFRARVLPVLQGTVAALDEARFWEAIAALGWGRKVNEVHDAGATLAKALSLRDCVAAGARFTLLERELERAFASWKLRTQEHIALAEDLQRDLRQHLIGLGQTAYLAAFRNPALAKQRGERDDYLDSFGKVFQLALQAYGDDAAAEALRPTARPFEPSELRAGGVVLHAEHGPGVVEADGAAGRYRVCFAAGELVVG